MQPDPEVAMAIGQDTLGSIEGATYNATAQVSQSPYTIPTALSDVSNKTKLELAVACGLLKI